MLGRYGFHDLKNTMAVHIAQRSADEEMFDVLFPRWLAWAQPLVTATKRTGLVLGREYLEETFRSVWSEVDSDAR